VSTNVGSLICLHRVKVLDEAASVAHGMDGSYGQGPIVPMVVKPPKHLILTAFSMVPPKCEDKYY
jgi:hypothetical protein